MSMGSAFQGAALSEIFSLQQADKALGSPRRPVWFSNMRPFQNVPIPVTLEKDDGLFCSDWREGAVFLQLIIGGNRSPEPVEGNAEGVELPHG